MAETSVKRGKPNVKLLKSDKKDKTSDIKFGIHEQAYLINAVLDKIQKYENKNPRNEDDEISYQFYLKLLEDLEYCRSAALPE